MNFDSYYDLPHSRGDDIAELSTILSQLLLKKLPWNEATNDHDCEIMETIADAIMDDEELLDAVNSYIRRGGKPRVHSTVYEDASDLYE
jgi:hypothetical protein